MSLSLILESLCTVLNIYICYVLRMELIKYGKKDFDGNTDTLLGGPCEVDGECWSPSCPPRPHHPHPAHHKWQAPHLHCAADLPLHF